MKRNMSEKLIIVILLSFAGGIFDAYSYALRGKTFATMQTGNIILLGYNLIEGNVSQALMYLIPIFSFFTGSLLSQLAENFIGVRKYITWHQVIIIFEVLCIIPSLFIKVGEYNFVSNMFISLASGAQLNTFRKTNGLSIATTMCTGNLKSAGLCLANFLTRFDKSKLVNMIIYFCLILSFFLGAVVSFRLVKEINIYAISIAYIPLLITFILMFFKFDKTDDKLLIE